MKPEENDIKLTINPTPEEEKPVQDVSSSDASSAEPVKEMDAASILIPEFAHRENEEPEDEPIREDVIIEPTPQPKTIEDIVKEEAVEAETQSPSNFSLSKILGGALLARIFQSQIKLVLLITVFLIIYITCRYQCQKQMVEIDRLEQKTLTLRYKLTVYSSVLTEKSRESNILEMLNQKGDSTLKIPNDPPYKINIPE